jgi:hypothetical protein
MSTHAAVIAGGGTFFRRGKRDIIATSEALRTLLLE